MTELILSEDYLATTIYKIRDQKVILDRDIARLYDMPTKALKQAVRRNIDRFPSDFMFELSEEELDNWRSQFVTSNADKMGLRYAPMAFTEQGVAMLSSVINSKRAIDVNIAIMRTFVKMRQWQLNSQKLADRLQAVDAILEEHQTAIEDLFDAFDHLSEEKKVQPRRLIGFKKQGTDD
jgi:ORF6N domain